MLFLYVIKAFKLGMYGASYVWMVPGYYSAAWQYVAAEGVNCSPKELQIASEGYLTVTFSMFGMSNDVGRCGKVRLRSVVFTKKSKLVINFNKYF